VRVGLEIGFAQCSTCRLSIDASCVGSSTGAVYIGSVAVEGAVLSMWPL